MPGIKIYSIEVDISVELNIMVFFL